MCRVAGPFPAIPARAATRGGARRAALMAIRPASGRERTRAVVRQAKRRPRHIRWNALRSAVAFSAPFSTTKRAARAAEAIARPIPSPPIGSSAAAALPIGITPGGHLTCTANLGSGQASQSPARVAGRSASSRALFWARMSASSASWSPRCRRTSAAGTLHARFQSVLSPSETAASPA